MKKAVITVRLVPEATKASNDQIECEIHDDSQIPWSDRIEKIEIIEE